MTSCDASVLWVGKSFNLVLSLLFVTLVRDIYHPDHSDHHADHFGHFDQPNHSVHLLTTVQCVNIKQYFTDLPQNIKQSSSKFWGLFPFGLDYFQSFRPPQPPSLEDEILRHLGPWERDQVKSTRAARQDTDGTNMTNRLVVNAGTALKHNLSGGMLILLLRALFSLFSQMHLG